MVLFILSLILRLIVTIQNFLNLGIAETAVYLRAVVEYRDFQISAKNDSYFSHREMLWADTPVCSYINAIRGLGNPQELKGIEMRKLLISIPFNSL